MELANTKKNNNVGEDIIKEVANTEQEPTSSEKKATRLGNEQKDQLVMSQTKMVTADSLQERWQKMMYRQFGGDSTNMLRFLDTVKDKINVAITDNPYLQNERVRRVSSTPSNLSKEELIRAMQQPNNNEQSLRQLGMLNYLNNYVYGSLLRLNREIPEYKIFAVPTHRNGKTTYTKEELAEYAYVNEEIIDKQELALQFKTINMQVQQEGKCSYLIRKSWTPKAVDKKRKLQYLALQKLPSDYIKIVGYGTKQKFVISFNLMLLLEPAWTPELFPQYIQDVWETLNGNGTIDYLRKKKEQDGLLGADKFKPQNENRPQLLSPDHIMTMAEHSYAYWVPLNQEDCFTFGQDLSHTIVAPETLGLFLDFAELEDYKWLMGNLMSKAVTTIVTGEVPLIRDPIAGKDSTAISPDMIMFLENVFRTAVSGTVLPFFAPLEDMKVHSIDNQPDNMNIVFNRTRDLMATAGVSGILSVNDKPSIAMIKGSQRLAASKAHYLTLQFKQFLTMCVNEQLDLENKYKFVIWSDIFDTEKFKQAKELLLSGYIGMLPMVLSNFDIALTDYKNLEGLVEQLDLFQKEPDSTLLSLKNEQVDEKVDEEVTAGPKKRGRKPLDDDAVENDNTADAKDGGDNVSDTKDFTLKSSQQCSMCGEDLVEGERVMCLPCLEQYMEELGI